MKEIEVKILEVNVPEIERKLLSLGAHKVFAGEVKSVVFDFPDKRLAQDQMFIRLRTMGKKAQLTVKQLLNRHEAKVSDEIETDVEDPAAMEKILLMIGLKQKRGYPFIKHRLSYAIDDVHFEFDTFPEFPTYLEIEAPSRAVIDTYVQKLGLSVQDVKPWGVREVFAYYRDQPK